MKQVGGSSVVVQWVSLVGVIWLQSINGTNSNFPAYSSELKQLLSLSQLQLNNLALASDAGKLFGWLAGIAALYLPLWLVLLIGSCIGFIGYGVQYLFLINYIPYLSYYQLFFLTVLAGNSICWINTVCYIVTIHNFPCHRQAAVGLTTSYFGLSAVIYTAVDDVMAMSASSPPSKTPQQYMLLNCLVPLTVSLVTAPFMRCLYDDDHQNNKPAIRKVEGGFLVLFIITVATGVYAVMSSLGPTWRRKSSPWPWVNVVGIGACLMTPLLIPVAEYVKCLVNRPKRRVCDDGDPTIIRGDDEGGCRRDDEIIISSETKDQNKDVMMSKDDEEGTRCAIEDIGVKQMVMRLNFWLYSLVYLCGATLGLVYVNNLGQIAESRGYSNTSSLVSFASAFVFFGRLLPSIMDYVGTRWISSSSSTSSRYLVVVVVAGGPGSMVIVMIPMAMAFFMLLNGTTLSLHVSTAIIAFSTGVITAIAVTTTSELFGATNFGVNHNVLTANIPIGSFLFGDLAAFVYRKQAGHGHGHYGRCMGLECYRMTFFTWGTLCSCGTILAFLLYLRTRSFYLRTTTSPQAEHHSSTHHIHPQPTTTTSSSS